MKIGMIGVLNNPSKSQNSHSAGWNQILAKKTGSEILTEKDDWDSFDRLVINHGLNFKPGVFNVIGGFNQDIFSRIEKIINYKGDLYQIDGFQLKELVLKRKLDYTYDKDILGYQVPSSEKLLVGDSHSVSIWPGVEYDIHRQDGKTLYGFLKNPVKADYYYFGNIDIRFHLARMSDPEASTIKLARRYVELAKENNAKVSCLLPVESETRKLPGTGKHKGRNFFGSRELRSNLVTIFNSIVVNSGLEVNQWPERWYQDVDFYEKEVMEPKQSVHVRPKYYQNAN